MNKNPNKKAGNWGALKNKPQNLVPFKSGGKVKVTAGGEKHVIYKKTTKRGEGKVGNIMVNHPTKDKGVWDTIDLTKKSGATTVKQGVASTKKWHKENPYNNMKKQTTKKYQNGGSTAADKVAEQRAINAKRKEEALARTEKSKTDARAKIDQAQKNKPVVKPVEPVAPAVTPNRKPESEYRTVIANPKIATIEMYDNKKVLRDSERTRKNGNRVVVQKTKEGDTVTRTKKVYNPSKETLTTKTKTYDRGNRKDTKVQTKNTTSTKPKPIKPIWGDPHTLKKGGSVKKKK